jgi:MFS family permease
MLQNTFASLRHRNFRYFWIGQCISLMGTWMQRAAQIWLVYSLTKSPALLGLLGVFQSVPMLVLALPAGVYADRLPKRRILLITQTVFMLQAFVLSALVWTGQVRYWQILVLITIFGITQTLDNPTRQSFFIELVGKEDLMNAISLNSSISNLAKIVGPSIAGIVMAELGPALCFLLNGISYLAVIYGLFLITAEGAPAKTLDRSLNLYAQAREGLAYVWNGGTLRFTMLLMGAVSVFTHNTTIIIPVFVDQVLNKGVREYGLLMSASGMGALIGALTMASRSRKGLNGLMMIGCGILLCVIQMVTGFTRNYVLAALLIAAMGFVNMAFSNMSNSTLQMNSSDEFRGRVMSVYAFVHNGGTPVGNSIAGAIMESMGAGMGFFVGGAATLAVMTALLASQGKSLRSTLLARVTA